MKRFLSRFFLAALVPALFFAGCNKSTTSGPGFTVTGGTIPTLTPGPYSTPQATPQAMVDLNSAVNYGALSYAGISNSGPTTVCGSLGTFPSASLDGGIEVICGGSRDAGTTPAETAQTDLTMAYNDAAGRSGGAIIPSGSEIGGQTLSPGLYTDSGNLNVASADLILDAKGNSGSVFIFQVNGDLIAGAGRKVLLVNGTKAANVFWQVGTSCSFGTTVQFKGIVMAHDGVIFDTGAALEGRAFSRTSEVAFMTNNITDP